MQSNRMGLACACDWGFLVGIPPRHVWDTNMAESCILTDLPPKEHQVPSFGKHFHQSTQGLHKTHENKRSCYVPNVNDAFSAYAKSVDGFYIHPHTPAHTQADFDWYASVNSGT